MPQAKNPLVPVQAKVTRIQRYLIDFDRNVLGKMRPSMQSFATFLNNIRRDARGIADIIGRSAIDSFINAGTSLLRAFAVVEGLLADAIRTVTKTLATIARAISNGIDIVYKVLRTQVLRSARAFRVLCTRVRDIVMNMSPIEIFVMVVQNAASTLETAFPWLRRESNMPKLISKAKRLIIRNAALLKLEVKTAAQFVKEVDKLKPA